MTKTSQDKAANTSHGQTLWHGRYEQQAADSLRKLNDSLPYDRRLYRFDAQGSAAYAVALAKAGVLTEEESQAIVGGLEQVVAEFTAGTFATAPGDEDIHTAVERRLGEIVGAVAGKLHTGRSRNDQVATDVRLWQADAIARLRSSVLALQSALLEQARQHVTTLMPGYTHLRAAQPITAGHWLLSYFWMLSRDVKRLDVCRESTLVS
ncbi:MAG TPA: lyase family protein, partial [Aggregatilineales bacterium]|nr:lyase family protein [Aggregatilineales bacterium]